MTSLIHELFAAYDYENFPRVELSRDGKTYGNRRLLISPQTTGEPLIITRTTYYANAGAKLLSAEELDKYARSHKYAKEFILFEDEAQAVVNGVMYTIPENGLLTAKAGCRFAFQFLNQEKESTVLSILFPTILSDEEPDYAMLIQRTREYLAGSETARL